MYIQKNPGKGYTEYLSRRGEDHGTRLDVGLLILDAGECWNYFNEEDEMAALLFEGEVEFAWNDQAAAAKRADCFREDPWCLHVCRGTRVTVTAKSHAEIYIQATDNPNPFDCRLYRPEDTMVQHAGDRGELMGCMRREIKTLFDYESAPYSNMVVGEVLNFPGKWSSYPPHHHPQPEVYFHRFDYPHGFGASFANGEIYKSQHNGLTVINHGFHSQAAAPGYAMCYVWGIRHLDGDPWRKTRIDDPEHAWLWKADANDHIFQMEDKQ